jgi:basic amino acid/polyamine antiporter, APA family
LKKTLLSNSLFRRKSLEAILEKSVNENKSHSGEGLKKVLKVRDLIALGIAAIIGGGIFSTIGQAAYDGGPAVTILFVMVAITCGFTTLCYAEFASRVPVSGSAYTYAYVTFGEIAAWIIGWALILEYSIGNVVVSISWSSYFANLLNGLGMHLPAWLLTDPATAKSGFESALALGKNTDTLAWNTAPVIAGFKLICNLPAAMIVILITILAYVGIKESRRGVNIMVVLKLAVIAVVVGIGIFYIDTDNWSPFMPNDFTGVLKGVSAVFFAYIGFDAISTTAEECDNPQRDLPRAMIYTLIICTAIFVVVALVITGMINYSEFNHVSDPLAYVFEKINLSKVGFFISVGAVIAATSVLIVYQIGQPRIWMTMSRDGLLPKRFSKIHPRFQTPGFSTMVAGLLVAIPSLFMEAGLMTDLASIGTLFAFTLVCGGVLLLPVSEKAEKRFKLPYINSRWIIPCLFALFMYGFWDRLSSSFTNSIHNPEVSFIVFTLVAFVVTLFSFLRKLSLIPVLGMLCCAYLMIEIPTRSWIVFFGWMAFGLIFYFSYGYWKSELNKSKGHFV